jgi:hypothetical protein
MSGSDNSLTMPLAYHGPAAIDHRTQDRWQLATQPIPCSVTKIVGELVQVKVEAQGKYTIPTLLVPQAFSEWVRQPTQVGDKGWVVPANYYLGGMSGNAGGVANYSPRGNLTTMVFMPISQKKFPNNTNRNLNQTFINGKEGTVNQTTDGKFSINVDGKNSKITLGADGSTITFTKDKVEITIGGNTHTFTATMFKSAGNVETSANTTLDTHIHPGTAPPVPGT